jgi:adenine-specific DNA-methyltransferase
MPEIQFKGKEFVFNHHLTVPYRPLLPDMQKSIGSGNLNENLIIQGDNLHALKALLPSYSGMVDCIFIDPPYNTGNENWAYNDNVNSPMLNEWLSSNPINKEDMLRHDKWLAMMYPRIKLLHELLSESGSLWMTLDDNEVHRARSIMDEIFGEQNFVATSIWRKNYAPKSSAKHFSEDHDYILVYAKKAETWKPKLLERTDEQNSAYKNYDNDERGPWRPNNLAARNYYSKGTYPITTPSGRIIDGPPQGSYWRVSEEKFRAMDQDNRIWWGADGSNVPAPKIFLNEVKDGRVPQTFWDYPEVGHTQDAKRELLSIFNGQEDIFITPKPTKLLLRVLELATDENSIVLDSFAGSGTTAHAVLEANRKDGGDRKFILVETEDYADTLTAERMRRVINGYSFTGVQKEELHSENITFTSLRRADRILAQINSIENLDGHRFDTISKEVKNGVLKVYGEKREGQTVDGYGGSFTYCTLGEPINIDKILTGETLPDYNSIGAWLFHTATGEALKQEQTDEENWFLGESAGYYVWLIYKPELEFLKSRASALTLDLAQQIATRRDKRNLVFAPAKYVPNKALLPLGVEYAPLPFALYRVEK